MGAVLGALGATQVLKRKFLIVDGIIKFEIFFTNSWLAAAEAPLVAFAAQPVHHARILHQLG